MKTSSASVAKIVEKKLESLFLKKKSLALKAIKQHLQTKVNKQLRAGELAACVQRVLEKKNQVYTIFYLLKYKRHDQRSPN